jgi:hypothetical protein
MNIGYVRRFVLFILLLVCTILSLQMIDPNSSMPNKDSPVTNTTAPLFKSGQKSGPTLCVIVRTFQKQYDYLTITLLSLSYNLQSNLRIYIVLTDDTSSVEDAHAISIIVNNLIGENIVSILPITSHDAYLIRNDNETDFGYGHTDAALNYLSKNGTTEQCHYFLITNGDNLYTKEFCR